MKQHDRNEQRRGMSRRGFLQSAAAFGVGGGILAACGGDDDDDDAGDDTGGGDAPEATDAPDASAPPSGDLNIKIGYVTPRTGPLAPFGEADAFVLAAMRAALGDGVLVGDHPLDDAVMEMHHLVADLQRGRAMGDDGHGQ